MKTKVRFYMEPNKNAGASDVLAVFPDERRLDYRPDTGAPVVLVACYSHWGQHSECCAEYLDGLKKATPEQYESLRRELENVVGYDFEVLG